MKATLICLASLSAATAFCQQINLPAGGASPKATYYEAYNMQNQTAITGRVVGKVKGAPASGVETMSLAVKARDGKTYQVDVGPTWYVARQITKIHLGDRVKVIGSPIVMQTTRSNREHVLLAREVIKGHEVLTLRDLTGAPYWTAYHRGRYAFPGSNTEITGQIVSQNPVMVAKEREIAYQIQTPDGLVNVALAPDWFLEQQGIGFKVGDNVTVYTGAGPVHWGNTILANGVYGSGGTIVLRPNGTPAWGGWNVYNGGY